MGEITQISPTAIMQFKLIQHHHIIEGHHFQPACDFLLMNDINIILSRTVFKILQSIGLIFVLDRVCLSVMHSFGVRIAKLQLHQETREIFLRYGAKHKLIP